MTANRAADQLDASKRRSAPGFTLLEILLVLSLLVIMAGLAWPAIENRLIAAQLPETADRFRSLLYLTRSAAMMDHHRYRIRFAKDIRDPVVEFEPDPIGRPDTWVASTADWAAESPLLHGVHVHDVIPGRPAYLTPVSSTPPEEEVGVETTTDLNEAQAVDTLAKGPDPMKDEQIDEKRPNMVFETDGSTDWATIVLAEAPSTEPLEPAMRQFWVVLDARTGLATVRAGITEEELASAEFTIPREKLILPNTKDLTDPTLSATTPGDGMGASGAFRGEADLAGASQQGLGGAVQDLQGTEAGADQTQPSTDVVAAGEAGTDKAGTEGESSTLANMGGSSDAMAELEKQLAGSDLTDEEKDQIRKTFQQEQRDGGKGTKGGG